MERNPLYDKAKGLGMILVIYGHMFIYGSIPFSVIFSCNLFSVLHKIGIELFLDSCYTFIRIYPPRL